MTSGTRHERTTDARRCVFRWCVTEHGSTVHHDDEDHRSAGIGLLARVRDAADHGRGISTDVEIGLLRRISDLETWVVVETGIGASVSLPIHAARALVAGIQNDAEVIALLAPEREID
ncbi:hypothetical protein [Microbacterium testaceum]|uniref:hypothetical protein n=1 Tax=Microbacterium testaceum TaxID=2033 RepID=UPI001143C992|nr:hypothetical protein [Microbacterium testaceum]WJS91484.1 hypothetical protein NYQ11_02715 [Microbacterium testaceum]